MRLISTCMLLACASLGAPGVAFAQETSQAPAPAPTTTPTIMDNAYDGRLHIGVAPYLWAPSVSAKFQFDVRDLPQHPGGLKQFDAHVGPSDYVPKLNSALMFAFDARKGNLALFGDYLYMNATVNGSTNTTLSGPLGKLSIPVSVNTTARLRQSAWSLAAGYTVGRSHNADLTAFAGIREFPLAFTFGYDATIGKRRPFTRSGTVFAGDIAQDAIFGVRGKAYFNRSRFFIPYYADAGTNIGHLVNQTYQAYTGGGYTFGHGQELLLLYRDAAYDGFVRTSAVQNISFYGPQISYGFSF